jgi:hypothetical protein
MPNYIILTTIQDILQAELYEALDSGFGKTKTDSGDQAGTVFIAKERNVHIPVGLYSISMMQVL